MSKPKYPCMLAEKFDASKVKEWPVGIETKLDGVRALFVIEPGATKATCHSREGNEFTSVYQLNEIVFKAYENAEMKNGLVLDGELFCGNFKNTVSAIRKKDKEAEGAILHVFDMIPYEEWKAYAPSKRSFVARRHELIVFMARGRIDTNRIQLSHYTLAHTEAEVHAAFEERIAAGKEGIIVKTLDSAWHPRRNRGWSKMKAEESEDLKVVGCVEGEGKYVGTMGLIQLDYNGVVVGCGTGFNDMERHEIWAMHQRGELLGKTAEIHYHEVTPDGSLRHPSWKGFRIDK